MGMLSYYAQLSGQVNAREDSYYYTTCLKRPQLFITISSVFISGRCRHIYYSYLAPNIVSSQGNRMVLTYEVNHDEKGHSSRF